MGYFKAYAGPLLLYALFFGQTAQIRIQDEWAHEAYTIDNMPVGVAIPLSVRSTVEKVILDMVETHIMPPDMTSFSDFDFFMEATALSELLNGKAISQFEALSSVGRYYEDCVLKGIATVFVNESAYYRSGNLLTDSYMPWGVYLRKWSTGMAQARALAVSDAHRTGPGEEWSQSATKHEGFQSAMQRTNSAWQSLSATQTRMAETQATFSASAGKNINTGTLLAVTSRADLERMAMPLGMTRLHGELHRGVNAIDSLRIAANADTASLMWQAEKVISGPRAR